MRNEKITIIILLLTLTSNVFGQSELARIIDKDGFTYLRSGQSIDSNIIDTVFENEFFYCKKSNLDWLEVTTIKWNSSGHPIKGFMHKSRIEIVDNMSNEKKKELIENVFKPYEKLGIELNDFVLKDTYDNENKSWRSKKDSLDFKDIYQRNNIYSEKYFSPLLNTFSKYFCETSDIETFDLFINTLWSHKGSANEMLSFTLGECFICNPELVQKRLISIDNPKKLDLMINHINWGLMNLFWTEEDGDNEPSSKEYLEYKERLKKLRK